MKFISDVLFLSFFLRISMSLLITSVILSGSLILQFVFQLLMNLQQPLLLKQENDQRQKLLGRSKTVLEDHPKCGITTGGREECWWSCTLVDPASPYPRYKVSLKYSFALNIYISMSIDLTFFEPFH